MNRRKHNREVKEHNQRVEQHNLKVDELVDDLAAKYPAKMVKLGWIVIGWTALKEVIIFGLGVITGAYFF